MCHIHIFHNEVWRMIKKWLKSDKIVTLSELHAVGKTFEFHCLFFRNGRFYSYKYTRTTGLTSSRKSPVEPRTFLLWGDGTNHCFLKLLRFGYFKGQSQIIQEDQRLYTQLSSVCCCTHAALASCNTSSRLWRLPLHYARRRKQEGTMLGVRKGVRKGCQRLCSAQILSVPEPILCDWCHTSPQQFVPRRCHTYWVSGANNTIPHAPYLQYRGGTQEALLFHCDTCALQL